MVSVNVVANATTDVVIDINGYYAIPTDGYQHALAPRAGDVNAGLDGNGLQHSSRRGGAYKSYDWR